MRSPFGRSKGESLSELGRRLGGRYQKGGILKGGRLELPHGSWTITVDDYSVHVSPILLMFIRLRAPYINRDGFRFRIYRKSAFSVIGKLFGVQDIETGDASFDDQFIVQGTPPSMVIRLLKNAEMKELMGLQRDILLEVKDKAGLFWGRFPKGVREVQLQSAGTIYDTRRVRELFELFTVVLDELYAMGSATPTNPLR